MYVLMCLTLTVLSCRDAERNDFGALGLFVFSKSPGSTQQSFFYFIAVTYCNYPKNTPFFFLTLLLAYPKVLLIVANCNLLCY